MVNEAHCWNCGSSLEPGVNYCSECGAEVDRDRGTETGFGDRSDGYETTDYGTAAYGTRGDDAAFAAVTHLLAIFTWVVGPLIVLVVTEDEFVDANARAALDWQIMFTVWMLLSFVLALVVIGVVGLMVLPLVNIAFCVIAAIKAYNGEIWQYPFTPEIV